MPNYKETSVTGTQWQRCNQVLIDNPFGGVPSITMSEEIIATLDGDRFIRTGPGIRFDFDPNAVIDILNPETGEPMGATITMGQIYAALWSVYMEKAAIRDAAP